MMFRPKYLLLTSVLLSCVACGGETGDDDLIDGTGAGATGAGAAAGTGGDSAGTGGDTMAGTGGDVATGTGGTGTVSGKDGKRVVGYLPTYRNMDPSNYDFDTMTHLCIAFANPGAGSLAAFDASDEKINAVVAAAHEKNVLVLASIAGAAGGKAVANEITSEKVDAYVNALLALIAKHNLDGIDVDIEGENVNYDYEPFVKRLSAALPAGKLLTAAVATWNGDDFSDGALAEYDFINLMSYDHCGPWSSACDHSSIEESKDELYYWETTRGISADKMVLGVPFYGYCWGGSCDGSAMTYADILSAYPTEAKIQDRITGAGYDISYNSPLTIAAKKTLADMHGGIMIWELGQDAAGADSLMSVIASN